MTATTVKAREIARADYSDLQDGDTLEVLLSERGVLVPATATVSSRRSVTSNPRRSYDRDQDEPERVGERLLVDVVTIFGMSTTRTLYTSDGAARLDNPGGQRVSLPLYVADDDGAEFDLAPTWGTLVTLAAFVPDAEGSVDEVRERIVKAITAEFKDDETRLHRVQSRPVRDERVTVTSKDGEVLAANVLHAESHYVAPVNGTRVLYHRPDAVAGR